MSRPEQIEGSGGRDRGDHTAERIRAAALRLIHERGYHGTSLRSVAAEAGIETASLYYHFSSKQELLFRIMSQTTRDLISTVEEAIADVPNPAERLRSLIRTHILFHGRRRMEAFIANSELRVLSPPQRKLVIELRDRYQRLTEAVIEDGIGRGAFEARDVKLMTYAIMATCTGVADWFRPDGRLSLDEVADELAALLLHGFPRGRAWERLRPGPPGSEAAGESEP